MTDTIYALATPPGVGGVAVIRVSGGKAFEGLRELGLQNEITPRHAVFVSFKDPVSRETLDKGLALPFRSPASFTGEDVVEYHLHGSPAVIKKFLETLSRFKGHRLAEPGEFTRRAFENGKLDLTEAEAVADLVHAQTELQRQQALNQLEGGLSVLYRGWSQRIKKGLAYLEAAIDFADEDLPDGFDLPVRENYKQIISEIDEHLSDNNKGERLRDGIHVAIIGAPNAGKSTLLNAFAKREVAIVSDIEGTTRDILEAHLDISGYPVILSDTAGLRPSMLGKSDQDKIESEGIRRAIERAQSADVVILLFDGDKDIAKQQDTLSLIDERSILVLNKIDKASARTEGGYIKISAASGDGLSKLSDALAERLVTLYGNRVAPSLTRQRHRNALQTTREHLLRSVMGAQADLTAEDARMAMRELGRITGRIDVEDLLDVIFSDFCIGK
ncbi:MAG: tRNA uridine-5-carboxymethylaminomethyl(34) synthesis GTPase MnmE [Alphaproteobacteria bacterium]|mgnify:CR=1 FL=1|nr:tRNA uridine-5-carboxymethylaminomethyl(34) synthesis GTPase MnmE [Alphaproteobacteria bacterium]